MEPIFVAILVGVCSKEAGQPWQFRDGAICKF